MGTRTGNQLWEMRGMWFFRNLNSRVSDQKVFSEDLVYADYSNADVNSEAMMLI